MADIDLLYSGIISALATGTGKQVGDGAAPSAAVLPFAVVYPIGDVDREAAMNELLKDGDLVTEVQVTSVGESREQAQWMSGQIREEFIASAISWATRKITLVELDDGNAVERDDDVQPPLFYGIDSFLVFSTPA